MNDEGLRLLSRSDERTDRARVLVEAMRRGELTYERLVWAARLGHEDALVAVGRLDRRPIEWDYPNDRIYALRGVSDAVAGLGFRRVLLSFLADCAERVLPLFEARLPGDHDPRRAIEAFRAWVASPTDAALEAARAAISPLTKWRGAGEPGPVLDMLVDPEEPGEVPDDFGDAGYRVRNNALDSVESLVGSAVHWCELRSDGASSGRFAAYAADATADAATTAARDRAAGELERSWQRARLADYALGRAGVEGLA